jgi:hypothetical protein
MTTQQQHRAVLIKLGWINQGIAKGVPALEHRWVNPKTKEFRSIYEIPVTRDLVQQVIDGLSQTDLGRYIDALDEEVNGFVSCRPWLYSHMGKMLRATIEQQILSLERSGILKLE